MYINMFLKIEIGSLIFFSNNNIPRIYFYTIKWTSEPNFNGLPSIPLYNRPLLDLCIDPCLSK